MKADQLYKELSLPLNSIARQGYALQHAVKQDRTGSTWVLANSAKRAMLDFIGFGCKFQEACTWAVENDLIRLRSDGCNEWLALAKNADAETALAVLIRESELEVENDFGLTDQAKLYWPDVGSIQGLTVHQRDELRKALRGRIGIFSGSAGTGKTYTLSKLLQACQDQGIGPVSLLAPTGKAAVRVTKALAEAGLKITREQRGRTIASLLFMPDEQMQPVGVGDETSMDDTSLLAGMLGRRPTDGHVILIGDPNQLAPVGHGAPLRDLIAAGLPFGQLTEVKRNGGRGLQACIDIVEKGSFRTSPEIDLAAEFPENLYLDEVNEPEQQMESLLEWLDSEHVDDPVWGCQVIVPINERSKVSRKEINQLLQNRLNPNGQRIVGTPFRIGDKCINTQNGYFQPGQDCPADAIVPNMGVYVANGDQGKVTGVESRGSMRWMVVEIDTPSRVVKVPIGKDGGIAFWDLAYAISCHKSQGAQWPVVIVMIDDSGSARQLCDKHWLLTGISRFQKLCILIGKNSTAQAYCKRSNMWQRKTFLVEKIRELRMSHGVPERIEVSFSFEGE